MAATLTAKGQPLSASQQQIAQTILNEGNALAAPGLAKVAAIYAAIWESDLSVVTSTANGHYGVFSGQPKYFPNPYDVQAMAYSFYKGGKGFQGGGAIALANQQGVSAISIAQTVEAGGSYSGEAGYPGDAQATLEAQNIVSQLGGASEALTGGNIFGLGGTGTAANNAIDSIWLVGNAQNPDQDYYTTINQYCQAAQWYVISDGETLYIADGIELLSTEPVAILLREGGPVLQSQSTYDNTSFTYTASHVANGNLVRRAALTKIVSPTQITMNVICEIDRFIAGDTVYLFDFGLCDGIWLVGESRRSIFQVYTELTLVQGMVPLNANSGLPLGPTYEVGSQATKPGSGTIAANMLAEADRINNADYRYIWGGGHAHAGSPDTGSPGGPSGSYDGHTQGFDCSGAVAAVLAYGGSELWPLGSSVPGDADLFSKLQSNGVLLPGPGSGTPQCTIYDNPGVHIFMRLSTASGTPEFFGTEDGSGHLPATPNQGAGWIPNGVVPGPEFRVGHIKQSILGQSASGVVSATGGSVA